MTWLDELWVEELSSVDLADMLSIPEHVHLGLDLLEGLVEGVVRVEVVRGIPVMTLVVPEVVLS